MKTRCLNCNKKGLPLADSIINITKIQQVLNFKHLGSTFNTITIIKEEIKGRPILGNNV